MIDIKLIRENKEMVKENIRKKFQDDKLVLVEQVFNEDIELRKLKTIGDELRQKRNEISTNIGILTRENKLDEVNKLKEEVVSINEKLKDIELNENKLELNIKNKMMTIPQIIDDSVPIGKNDTENVEIQKFGEQFTRSFEVPYHADIFKSLDGFDKESAGRTSGEGFYYLMGDIALLNTALLNYARDFMLLKGFDYYIPPFMIRSDVVEGVMSFKEIDDLMYKIEGEDLYLIGTSEHSLIGKFKDQIIDETKLPLKITGYSPCFRKEVGAHGIEERGIYRVHQFEKQEMIIICKPEESKEWFEKMLMYTVDIFRSLNISVRTLECCSGDLTDLKVKSCDVEAWSPRQQKYYEVGSCSNLGDAQARRLGIRSKIDSTTTILHTLNNTVIATSRGLIAFVESNYQEDGTILIPEVLRPYMGGRNKLILKTNKN